MVEKRLVIWLIVSALATAVLSASWQSSLPIKFVKGTRRHGDLVVAKRFMLSGFDPYREFSTERACTCREACWAHPPCMAVSYLETEKKVFCRLSSKGPHNSSLRKLSNATYIYRTESVPQTKYEVREDGVLYLLSANKTYHSEAKEYCERIPGHRFGMFKEIAQYNALLKIHQELDDLEILVDMYSSLQGPKWGDGTLFQSSPSYAIAQLSDTVEHPTEYRMVHSVMFDSGIHEERHFLCQAHPLGGKL